MKMLVICPSCQSSTKVTQLTCTRCGLKMEGNFRFTGLLTLSEEQRDFAEVFIRNRGNIREVEKALGISYPTVRAKLDNLVNALGAPEDDVVSKRKTILKQLQDGEISTKDAMRRIAELNSNGEKEGN